MNLLKLAGEQRMTSKEIATLTGKNHADVLRDIRNMQDSYIKVFGGQSTFAESSYSNAQNKKQPMFSLNKSQALFVISGYNAEIRAMIQKRWEHLEAKFISRNTARLENPVMTRALQDHRTELGKDTKSFHYSNENNLVYLVVLGATAKKYREALDIDKEESLRDELTPLQIDAIEKIQNMNTTLINLGFDYKDRKKQLNDFFNKRMSEPLRIEFSEING